MADFINNDVVIIGAGPVGLTLAIDLAQRGLEVKVLELRHRGEPPSVKCNHVSARSMELFRQLGIAAQIRDTGLPPDYPNDVAYRTTMVAEDMARILIPCRRDRFTSTDGPDTRWPTPEPPHRINQIFLEPVIFAAAEKTPSVTILNEVAFDRFEEAGDHINVFAHSLKDDRQIKLSTSFMVGCDGGRSKVRKQMGVKLTGDAVVQRVQSTYIRAPKLISLMRTERAWANFSLNPRRCGNVYAIDGRETWIVHNYLRDDELEFDSVDRDRAIRDILGVDDNFSYQVLGYEDWFGRRLVADKLREGRVFIAGDAAHLWVPYAGYGMNAGLADAADLAWQLAGMVNGWGGPALLDAYERERHPITEQVSYYAMNHAHASAKQRDSVPANIDDDTPDGEAARAALGKKAYDLNVQQYACAGLNFGYFYDKSPIISYDGEKQPEYSMGSFTPSTVPGCRTPHFWLEDGNSLYDAIGPDFALLRTDPSIDISRLESAAHEQKLPLRIVDISPPKNIGVEWPPLLLSRPDRHVAWRGNEAPQDANALIALVRGADPACGLKTAL